MLEQGSLLGKCSGYNKDYIGKAEGWKNEAYLGNAVGQASCEDMSVSQQGFQTVFETCSLK